MGKLWKNVKNREIDKSKVFSTVKFIAEIYEILVVIFFSGMVIGVCFYLYSKIGLDGMDIIVDFVIAGMSGLLTAVSIIKNRLKSKEQKYICLGTILIAVFSVGFLVVLILAAKQTSSCFARIISTACLMVTIFIEIYQYVILVIAYVKEKRNKRDNGIKQQEEGDEQEKLNNKKIARMQRRPYLVIAKDASYCRCKKGNEYHMTICLKNKGNGSAFNIETEGIIDEKDTIEQKTPIEDPVIMVNEICKTKWKFDSSKQDFQFSITVKYEDMCEQLYQQKFEIELDNCLKIKVKNCTKPELIKTKMFLKK